MKARNLLWISMVNIFLLLLVSVIMEYTDLTERFRQLENIVSTSTDTAVRNSMATEEFFSSNYKSSTTSIAKDNNGKSLQSTLKIFNGGTWVIGKTYVMAKYYGEKGKFPDNQTDYNTYATANDKDEVIYKWLYGGTGSAYNLYGWANSGSKMYGSLAVEDLGKDREPSARFKAFYDNIGYKMRTKTYVKVKSGTSYTVEEREIPVLAQMGLKLTSYNDKSPAVDGSSDITNDFLNSVTHFGKSASGVADTTYYFTPYTLGVTYIPTEVLKPVLLSHLEQMVRFSRVKHTVTDSSTDMNDFGSATGCISTEVFDGDRSSSATHKSTVTTNIINDGQIEYDLSTLKTKVDYFYVDFYDDVNVDIVQKIEGTTPAKLKERDTSASKNGNRIVARVTVKLKVHVPYKSSILQWFRHLNDSDGTNHYDIRLWDTENDTTDISYDGVWFSYTTYTAVKR